MNVVPFTGGTPRASYIDRAAFPFSAAAEESVLGGVIVKNEVLDLLGDVEVDDFYIGRNRIVWQAIRALQTLGKPIDVVMLEVEIEKAGKLDAIGGVGYIGELALRVPTADRTVEYASEIQSKRRRRDVIIALGSATARAQTDGYEDGELIIETIGELQRIDLERGPARTKKHRWTIPLGDFLGDAEPDTDDSDDWVIRDLVPRGEPFLWGGPMKGGKTWAALDLLLAISLGLPWLGKFENTFGRPVRALGVFMEDSKRRLRARLWELARAYNTTPNNKVLQEHLSLSSAPLRLPDAADQRRITTEIKAWGASVVILDNLTRVMVGDPNNTRDAALFTRAWTEIGQETGAAIGFLHHTRKDPEDGKERDPFSLIRGSTDFGACARNMIVVKPIRSATSTVKSSEVFMRGNLDLRRESFALGFERTERLGKFVAKLADRGDVVELRDAVHAERKAEKETKKRDDRLAMVSARRDLAVQIARRDGCVSSGGLGLELGLSPNAVLPILRDLVASNVLVPAGKRGFELADANPQRDLIP